MILILKLFHESFKHVAAIIKRSLLCLNKRASDDDVECWKTARSKSEFFNCLVGFYESRVSFTKCGAWAY